MSFVRRAEYEHFWQLLAKSRKPLPQKSIEPIRARLVQALESDDRIIVEKVHFTSHDNSLMEVVCTWVGLDANEQDATLATQMLWTTDILQAEAEKLNFDPQEDLFYFQGQAR